MKKRHEQKLLILSLLLWVLFNFPFITIFNTSAVLAGIPVIYAYLFSVWLLAVIICYYILNRHLD